MTEGCGRLEFLRQHLGVDKVTLLAESMGTLTGLPLVKHRPDLLHALVVTDLYVDMAANEAAKWQLTLERLRAVATPGQPTAYAPMALLTTRDLVEAAAQTGALEGMEPLVARFERWAQADQRASSQGGARSAGAAGSRRCGAKSARTGFRSSHG